MTASFSQPSTTVGPVPLHESVVFLARFLGTPVQVERLRDSLASHDLEHGAALSAEAMGELLRHAGLVGSPLPVGRPWAACCSTPGWWLPPCPPVRHAGPPSCPRCWWARGAAASWP